jgi:tripartite-type tricarboxylate transporter receptor subunit TctC
MTSRDAISVALFACAIAPLAAAPAAAQGYPNKPVRLVVPFPAASATDQVARVLGLQLNDSLGQSFVIDNRPGASGSIAATTVAKSAADGYTLMVTTNTPQAANVSLFKKLPYDPVKDFAPIARIGTISFMLMVRGDFSPRNLQDFIAHARANPGKLSAGYGSSGSQVSLAMLKSMAKLDVLEVPYKGIPQAVTEVLGGQLAFTFVDLANALAQAKGGKLRGIAITSEKRSTLAPDVPAVAEQLPGYELIAWFGLVAPVGTPKAVVARLHEETVKALGRPDVKERFSVLGTDIAPMNPAEFDRFIRSEIAKWARLAKEAGIEPQ